MKEESSSVPLIKRMSNNRNNSMLGDEEMSEVVIDDIIGFLDQQGYNFNFTGNKADKVNDFSTLFNYKEGSLTFVSSLNDFGDYIRMFEDKKIQLIITGFKEKNYDCFENTIQVEKPKSVFFSILEHFFNEDSNDDSITNNPEAYKRRSFISDKATIGRNVKIGVGSVIEGNVTIGDDTVIHHNVVIRAKSHIGKNCVILSGAVIGESGFNPLKDTNDKRNLVKHYGGVRIEDDVHIGDQCAISKGTIEDTIIKTGVKLNKQVVIAHNVIVGEDTVVTTPVFVGGSVKIGKGCHIAATTIRNQCNIGDGARLGLGSVVVKDVQAGETVIGVPARPMDR